MVDARLNFDKSELIINHNRFPNSWKFKHGKCELIIINLNKKINSILVEDNCNKCNRMLGYYSKTGLKRTDRINIICDDCRGIK